MWIETMNSVLAESCSVVRADNATAAMMNYLKFSISISEFLKMATSFCIPTLVNQTTEADLNICD